MARFASYPRRHRTFMLPDEGHVALYGHREEILQQLMQCLGRTPEGQHLTHPLVVPFICSSRQGAIIAAVSERAGRQQHQ